MPTTPISLLEFNRNSNSPHFILNIDGDVSRSILQELTDGFREYQSLRSLELRTGDDAPIAWDNPDLHQLFAAIGNLPNIIELKMNHFGNRDNPAPVKVLTDLMKGLGPKLQVFQLIGPVTTVQFTDGQEPVEAMREALQDLGVSLKALSCLRNFQMRHGCYIRLKPDAPFADFAAPVLANVSTQPMLANISFFPSYGMAAKDPLEFLEILAYPKLEQLRITQCQLDLLGRGQCLQLLQNLPISSHLQVLEVFFMEPDEGECPEWRPALACLLESNRGIKTIKIDFCDEYSQVGVTLGQLSNVISKHELPKFKAMTVSLFPNHDKDSVSQESLAKMLESNATLEKVDFKHHSNEYFFMERDKIDFYLRMNCNERAAIVGNMFSLTQVDWMDVFCNCSLDIQSLHYYLQLNPAGWCPGVVGLPEKQLYRHAGTSLQELRIAATKRGVRARKDHRKHGKVTVTVVAATAFALGMICKSRLGRSNRV